MHSLSKDQINIVKGEITHYYANTFFGAEYLHIYLIVSGFCISKANPCLVTCVYCMGHFAFVHNSAGENQKFWPFKNMNVLHFVLVVLFRCYIGIMRYFQIAQVSQFVHFLLLYSTSKVTRYKPLKISVACFIECTNNLSILFNHYCRANQKW